MKNITNLGNFEALYNAGKKGTSKLPNYDRIVTENGCGGQGCSQTPARKKTSPSKSSMNPKDMAKRAALGKFTDKDIAFSSAGQGKGGGKNKPVDNNRQRVNNAREILNNRATIINALLRCLNEIDLGGYKGGDLSALVDDPKFIQFIKADPELMAAISKNPTDTYKIIHDAMHPETPLDTVPDDFVTTGSYIEGGPDDERGIKITKKF